MLGGIFLIIYLGSFVYYNLRAELLYERAVNRLKPTEAATLINYYRNKLGLLSKAIRFNKNNADYLVSKADRLTTAVEDELKSELSIVDSEIEDLYKSAIKLNPINFEYHLKLGWFYVDKDEQRAEAELSKAVQLYPTDYQPYLYLARFYLKTRDRKSALTNLLLSFNYSSRHIFSKEIKDIESDLIGLSYNREKRGVEFTIYPKADEFDFKKEGLPHRKMPLEFKAYVNNVEERIALYRKGVFYADFRKLPVAPELSIHEFALDALPKDTYLDDFMIKTNFGSPIEKLEIIKKF